MSQVALVELELTILWLGVRSANHLAITSLAKEELAVDQFLMEMDSHELKVQVMAHGHRHIEDVL